MYSKIFDELNDINDAILSLAQTHDWDNLSKKASLRQKKVELLFTSKENHDLKKLTQLERKIKSTDTSVFTIIEKQKKKAIENSLSLKNTQSALKAYAAHEN